MQGYPFGTFLLWKVEPQTSAHFRFYDFVLNFHERDARHCPELPTCTARRYTRCSMASSASPLSTSACITLTKAASGGDCWDNSAMESFFSTMKTECTRRKNYVSPDETRADVFDHIEQFYNPSADTRTLGYLSLVDYEKVALSG